MTTVEQPPQDPPREDAPPPPPAGPSFGRRFAKIFGGVAAGVGFVSSVAGLVFLFAPWLQPDDDDAAQPPPPAARFGRLTGLVLDPDATRRQYLDRTDQAKLGFTEAQLAQRVAFVQFRVELVGFSGTKVPMQLELVDARTGDELTQISAFTVTPPTDHESAPWHDWVPLRRGTGRYVIVIKLRDAERSRSLDCAQSPAFGGLGGIAPGKTLALCAGA
jgi:hypothetical protein